MHVELSGPALCGVIALAYFAVYWAMYWRIILVDTVQMVRPHIDSVLASYLSALPTLRTLVHWCHSILYWCVLISAGRVYQELACYVYKQLNDYDPYWTSWYLLHFIGRHTFEAEQLKRTPYYEEPFRSYYIAYLKDVQCPGSGNDYALEYSAPRCYLIPTALEREQQYQCGCGNYHSCPIMLHAAEIRERAQKEYEKIEEAAEWERYRERMLPIWRPMWAAAERDEMKREQEQEIEGKRLEMMGYQRGLFGWVIPRIPPPAYNYPVPPPVYTPLLEVVHQPEVVYAQQPVQQLPEYVPKQHQPKKKLFGKTTKGYNDGVGRYRRH